MSALPLSLHNITHAAGEAGLTLSWNSARFLALILNALAGILQFYKHDNAMADPDSIFALRVMEGHLAEIYSEFEGSSIHPAILTALNNLSMSAHEIAVKSSSQLLEKTYFNVEEARRLFGEAHRLGLPVHQKLNEDMRWSTKDLLPRDSRHESTAWFDGSNEKFFLNCVILLFNEESKVDKLSECVAEILQEKGRIGFKISRQVFFVGLAKMANQLAEIGAKLRQNSSKNSPIFETWSNEKIAMNYVEERCANMRDELTRFRRDKKKLARLSSSSSIDLLMEQIFACLQFGFVDFAEPHILVTALAWQHPTLGCYTARNPDSIPHLIPMPSLVHKNKRFSGMRQTQADDACLYHTTSAIAVTIVVFLRYLLDPGPWPEFRFAEQLVQIGQIVAEDRFSTFKYAEWVRDPVLHALPVSQPFGGEMDQKESIRHHEIVSKPPPMAWSPDLIAFVVLLLVFVTLSVVAHHFLGNGGNSTLKIGGKRTYPYAFKKL